ncbi:MULTISPECIES: acid phosphatase [Dyella]|nr:MULTISPECIES: phosphatase PAP2 family protein [Dyella]
MTHARATIRTMGLGLCVLALGACTATSPKPAETTQNGRPPGYLAEPTQLTMAEVLPAAPQAGSVRYEADREVFRQTRKLEGSPRWALATSDVKTDIPDMLQDFSCSVGVSLDSARLPRLTQVLKRVEVDTDRITGPAKKTNQRLRPFLIDEGNICQAKDRLKNSFDYPSGHSTWGWTVGTVLSELAPDRITPIMLRARSYAESRVVCGAHNLSAIQMGMLNGATIMMRVQMEPAYQADIAAAKKELDAVRASSAPMPEGQCKAERALITPVPY